MGKRKITILEPAVEEIALISLYIEAKGLPKTAIRFVDDVFTFFESLSDERIIHRPCKQPSWRGLGYRCINFRKKYIVSYLDNTDEIIICEFALQKLLQ
ncbi:type II toxin-antitoxin system RelE/ParE family toxin [Flavitalea flava]